MQAQALPIVCRVVYTGQARHGTCVLCTCAAVSFTTAQTVCALMISSTAGRGRLGEALLFLSSASAHFLESSPCPHVQPYWLFTLQPVDA